MRKVTCQRKLNEYEEMFKVVEKDDEEQQASRESQPVGVSTALPGAANKPDAGISQLRPAH